jgi:hypothetical protein
VSENSARAHFAAHTCISPGGNLSFIGIFAVWASSENAQKNSLFTNGLLATCGEDLNFRQRWTYRKVAAAHFS